ncbi:hypothetical protein [Tenacibaculum aquimarinum]|uniref:hypothetical protein n=1 Tax=Tenacibaculum aquimarinum TaxID=2910675 RepID=UPI001F0A0A0C|nr:hypothetical protein [Tenacibaculum aquimarinum]MCH3884405.1 hypothetical protein [Tenacibaculum aquimarinum]
MPIFTNIGEVINRISLFNFKKTGIMDDIEIFMQKLSDNYPETWINVDDLIKYIIPNNNLDPFDGYKSKYYKKFITIVENKKVKYIPLESASKSMVNLDKILYPSSDNFFIDYKHLLKELKKDDFDIESWSNKRTNEIIKDINNFLFECNIYKGVVFFSKLGEFFSEIIYDLNSLKKNKPINYNNVNWLQTHLLKSLEAEIANIKKSIIHHYLPIYPKLDKILNKTYSINKLDDNSELYWYKIAKEMAKGYISIDKSHYIIDNKEIYSETEAAKLLSKEIYGTDTYYKSISINLNQTKSKSISNKNIFRLKNLESLKHISKEVSNYMDVSEYFMNQLSFLRVENNSN